MENVNEDGSLSDTFDGRLINPGRTMEAMWFIMDLGQRLNRPQLIQKAVETTVKMVEYGWDKLMAEFLFYGPKGSPPNN